MDGSLIEDRNVEQSADEVVEMMNGCICCTVRADLQALLKKLLITEKRVLHAIIIETTGLADPAPVAQTFFVDEDLQGKCYLDAIITMVDAHHIDQQLSRERPEGVENEAEEQLAFADKIILNKLDLVPDRSQVEATKARLRKYNPTAEIIETINSEVAAERLMGLDAFNLARVMEKEPDFLDTGAEHKHDSTVASFCVQSEGAVVQAALERWIGELMQDLGNDLFRYKGILNVKGCELARVARLPLAAADSASSRASPPPPPPPPSLPFLPQATRSSCSRACTCSSAAATPSSGQRTRSARTSSCSSAATCPWSACRPSSTSCTRRSCASPWAQRCSPTWASTCPQPC